LPIAKTVSVAPWSNGRVDPTDSTAPDEALLRAFVAGDRGALGELAERYEGPLLGLSAALLGGRRDLAMDAVQETWVRVIQHGGKFDGRSSFKTWLYRIAINQCRTAKARMSRPADNSGAQVEAEVAPAAMQDGIEGLHAAVEALSPERRIVVLLCYHRGMTHECAAEILGLPVGTLKTRLRAAMTELRAKLHAGVKQ
jgi:RNA polymerase sigma-70 factor, ECF subfamily